MFPKDGFSHLRWFSSSDDRSAVDFSDWLGLSRLKGAETPVQGICARVSDVLASFLWQHGKDGAVLQQPGHEFKHCHHFLRVPDISFKNRTCDVYVRFVSIGTVTFGLVSPANSHVTHRNTSVQSYRLTDGRQQLCSHWLTSWRPPVGVWHEGQRGTLWFDESGRRAIRG